jgi:hypothetical protein
MDLNISTDGAALSRSRAIAKALFTVSSGFIEFPLLRSQSERGALRREQLTRTTHREIALPGD